METLKKLIIIRMTVDLHVGPPFEQPQVPDRGAQWHPCQDPVHILHPVIK